MFEQLEYPRRGDLLARIEYWLRLRELVQRVTTGLGDEEWIVVDLDSRLTQLGFLPLAADDRTRFMPTRTIQLAGLERLADIAGAWASALVGTAQPARPRIWSTEHATTWAGKLRSRLDANRQWVVVHFGVGGNSAKSLGAEFEGRLVRRLAADGLGILLCRGVGDAELTATAALTARLVPALDVLDLPAGGALDALEYDGSPQVVTWQGSTEDLAAVIRQSNLYVGYDSAGQHVAAAVGTPGVTAFVMANGRRHMRRWSASGLGTTRVIPIIPGAFRIDEVVAAIVAATADLLRGADRPPSMAAVVGLDCGSTGITREARELADD